MQRRPKRSQRSRYVLLLIGPRHSSWLCSIIVGVGHPSVLYHGIWNSGCGMCWYLEFMLGLTSRARGSDTTPASSSLCLSSHWARKDLLTDISLLRCFQPLLVREGRGIQPSSYLPS
ncbi:hypothetical protein OH77DRAFT_1181163 [Trametes cingulata]|nr:hypothetical protein OH77DRAFT_1181163 [Trametes cingulata]